MRLGGGSLFLKREGRFIGPGHTGIFSERGTVLDFFITFGFTLKILGHIGNDWLSYHYYDGERDGLPWVDIRKIEWANGWPKVTEERFSADDYFGQR